jgi:hypothetical protein
MGRVSVPQTAATERARAAPSVARSGGGPRGNRTADCSSTAHDIVRRRHGGTEVQDAVRRKDKDPVEHQGIEVDVEIERPSEALHTRHHAGLAFGEPLPFGLPAIRGAKRAHEDAEHRATEAIIVGEPIAEAVGTESTHRPTGRRRTMGLAPRPLPDARRGRCLSTALAEHGRALRHRARALDRLRGDGPGPYRRRWVTPGTAQRERAVSFVGATRPSVHG